MKFDLSGKWTLTYDVNGGPSSWSPGAMQFAATSQDTYDGHVLPPAGFGSDGNLPVRAEVRQELLANLSAVDNHALVVIHQDSEAGQPQAQPGGRPAQPQPFPYHAAWVGARSFPVGGPERVAGKWFDWEGNGGSFTLVHAS